MISVTLLFQSCECWTPDEADVVDGIQCGEFYTVRFVASPVPRPLFVSSLSHCKSSSVQTLCAPNKVPCKKAKAGQSTEKHLFFLNMTLLWTKDAQKWVHRRISGKNFRVLRPFCSKRFRNCVKVGLLNFDPWTNSVNMQIEWPHSWCENNWSFTWCCRNHKILKAWCRKMHIKFCYFRVSQKVSKTRGKCGKVLWSLHESFKCVMRLILYQIW